MAKSVNTVVHAQREELIRLIKGITGLELKRANIKTTTAGLSVSNKDMRANMFAHLLCNANNFQTVAWMLENWKEFQSGDFIPEEYASIADPVSVGYACGTSPRFVLAFNSATKSKVDRHQSKDAAKTGRPQEFIAWAQSWRMAATQSLWVGTSRSVKTGTPITHTEIKIPSEFAFVTGSLDGYYMENFAVNETLETECQRIKEIPSNLDEMQAAIESQKRLASLLAEGGLTIAKTLSSTKDFAAAANAALERLRAKKAADAAKATEVKPEVVKTEVKVSKPKTGKAGKAAKAA